MTESDIDITAQVRIEPVRVNTIVDAPLDHAFTVFTSGMNSWWPRSHHIGGTDDFTAVLEPLAGGRWYERGDDGSECDWGRVIAWEPPDRVVLDWQIQGHWAFDPALHTEVELRFVAEDEGRTRVELQHRNLDAFGDQASAMRQGFDAPGGWNGVLRSLADAAAA